MSAEPPRGERDLHAAVLAIADEVIDPCSLAQGVPAGLAEMGLVHSVALEDAGAGTTRVRVRLRLTAPGCLYGVAFERELRARLLARADVAAVEVEWDGTFDWTPEDMAASLRARLEERRGALRAAGSAA